jgi:hypothetical protein
MVRRRWWHALVEVPSLWFGLQLVELVIAFGLLPILTPDGWTRWGKLVSALVVYVLLAAFNYGVIQRSQPRGRTRHLVELDDARPEPAQSFRS